MTLKGEFKKLGFYVPEAVLVFATVFLLDKQDRLVWTLAADRKEANKWTPPGGEIDINPDLNPYDKIDLGAEALREVEEETGTKAILVPEGFRPFNMVFLNNAYGGFDVTIKKDGKDEEAKRTAAHAMLFHVLARITEGEPRPMQEEESDSRTVDVKALTLAESVAAIDNGSLLTFPAIAEGTRILNQPGMIEWIKSMPPVA